MQLLEVVRHRLRHKWKVRQRTEARQSIRRTVGSPIAIVRSLHAQTVRKHADVMLLLYYLVFAARVLYGVYLGVFAIFCKGGSRVEKGSWDVKL